VSAKSFDNRKRRQDSVATLTTASTGIVQRQKVHDTVVEPAAVNAAHDLGHYTRPLRRHRLLIIVCTLLGIALGGFVAKGLPGSYTSTSRVLVLADITDQGTGNTTTGRSSDVVNMDTEAQLVKSEPLAAAVKAMLGSPASPTALASRLTVSVPANTTLMDLTFKAGSPEQAKAGAAAYATAYLDKRTSVAQHALAQQTNAVTKQIAAAENRLRSVTETVASTSSSSSTGVFARQQQQTLQAQLDGLGLQLNQLTTAPVDAGRVVSPASAPAAQNLKGAIIVVSLTLLGLLLGIGLAVWRDRSGRSVRNSDDLAAENLRIVGQNLSRAGIPTRRSNAEGGPAHQAAATFAASLGQRGVVYVAGVTSSTVASRIGGQIAAELRRFGSTVQVIQLEAVTGAAHDLPQPELPGESPAEPPTWFMTLAGLHAAGLKGQVTSSREKVDYVLIAGGNATKNSEAYLVASSADATLLVTEAGVSTRRDLRRVADDVRLTSTRLIGVALVRREKAAATTDGLVPVWQDSQPPASQASQASQPPVNQASQPPVKKAPNGQPNAKPAKSEQPRVLQPPAV
jgi:capsular polysaccharide biosynthesis protein